MLVAVLGDIHSNPYALSAVIADIERAEVDEIWLLGDTFGYHPWAAETFRAIGTIATIAVLGNHDQWVLHPESADSELLGSICRQNAEHLRSDASAGLDWLARLPKLLMTERSGWRVTVAHGTPASPLEGRYYPDDHRPHPWLPGPGQILLLGQTHRPILRGHGDSGLLLNPGSVGQPRDGNPMPSWALLDLATGTARLKRSRYDNLATIERLHRGGWHESTIAALNGHGELVR